MSDRYVNKSERKTTAERKTVSVVLPVYNELAALEDLIAGITGAFEFVPCNYEIIFVDDGSTDGSAARIDAFASSNPRIRAIHFSRNFGHQSALHAGLTASRGDAILVMDSDLQDDSSAIPKLIAEWEAGYEVVYAIRSKRKENRIKRALFFLFYRILGRISDVQIPPDAGNFGLIDRRAADQIISLPEVSRFYPGLRSWIGFRQTGIEIERAERHDQHPRVSVFGLIRLARTAVFSFSTAPLSLFYGVAFLSCICCFALTSFTLFQKFNGDATPGWASGLITASFFGMLNALGIAVLGEYVVRIFDQVRDRPNFIIDRTVNLTDPEQTAESASQFQEHRQPLPATRPIQHAPHKAVINEVNS